MFDRKHREGKNNLKKDFRTESAIILTLIENAKRCGHDPYAYIRDVLERMPQARTREERLALLPRNWKPSAKPETAASAAA